VDGGFVFTPVYLSVCFSVSEQDISKSYRLIWTKFGGQVGCVAMIKCFNFGEDPGADTRILKRVFFQHWEIGPKTIHSTVSQKVLDGFWQNLVDELGRWQEQIDEILVKVRIQIQPISGRQNVNCPAWSRYRCTPPGAVLVSKVISFSWHEPILYLNLSHAKIALCWGTLQRTPNYRHDSSWWADHHQ